MFKYLPAKEGLEKHCLKYYKLKPILNSKERINAALRYAVWSGKIKKPIACSRCGEIAKRICGHHHKGYLKKYALDVIWLCDSCHSFIHAK